MAKKLYAIPLKQLLIFIKENESGIYITVNYKSSDIIKARRTRLGLDSKTASTLSNVSLVTLSKVENASSSVMPFPQMRTDNLLLLLYLLIAMKEERNSKKEILR